MLSPSSQKSPSGSHHHPRKREITHPPDSIFFKNVFPHQTRGRKLCSVSNKKNPDTTNHPFEQREILLNNNDYSADVQNFKYQNTVFNKYPTEENV